MNPIVVGIPGGLLSQVFKDVMRSAVADAVLIVTVDRLFTFAGLIRVYWLIFD